MSPQEQKRVPIEMCHTAARCSIYETHNPLVVEMADHSHQGFAHVPRFSLVVALLVSCII